MKRILSAIAAACLCAPAFAQTPVSFFGPNYSFETVTAPGIIPHSLLFNQGGAAPAVYTLDWSSATAPRLAPCRVKVVRTRPLVLADGFA
jgi:hypothetical protein